MEIQTWEIVSIIALIVFVTAGFIAAIQEDEGDDE